MNRYIESNNIGIIALIKRNDGYEYNAIDSSYCVLNEYEKDIKSQEYFEWIESTKLDYKKMNEDFSNLIETEDNEKIRNYLIWEKPNIVIDFDSKYLANCYNDRAFEDMTPNTWKSEYIGGFQEFKNLIPINLRYWDNCQTLIDYLNGFSTELQIEQEFELINKATKFWNLNSYEERWNKFEVELGGNILSNKDYGWLSLKNYSPNIVVNRETKKIFLANLLDKEFLPKCEIRLSQIQKLLTQELTKIKKEKTDKR